MIIVTTDQVPGMEIKEWKGFVKGNTIQTKHLGKDIMASLKNLVGGEIADYTEMMSQARQVAIGRMVEDAEEKGANAIVGCRLQTSSVMNSASEVIAYGTAVIVE